MNCNFHRRHFLSIGYKYFELLQLLQVIRYAKMATHALLTRLLDEYFDSDGETARSDLLKCLRSVNAGEKYVALHHVSYRGLTAVHFAAARGDPEMLRCLLRSLPDAQLHELMMIRCKDNWTAVHYAATFGQTEALRIMIDRPELTRQKDLLYLKDDQDVNALDMAIAQGHVETAEFIYKISPKDQPFFKYLIAVVLIGGTIFLFFFSKLYSSTIQRE